jgi:hypothetical protein
VLGVERRTAQSRLPAARSALVTAALLLLVVGGATATVGAATASGSSGPGSCVTRSSAGAQGPGPLRGVCKYLEGRMGVAQVAVFDKRTGETHRLRTANNRQVTASIVKVDVLSRWLRRYQRRGVAIPDEIPYSIQFLMQQMIENSDNAAATSLFYFGGGCEALTRFNRLIPLRETKVGCQTPSYYGWGNTVTTAADQARLMRLVAYGQPRRLLGRDARRYALGLMQSVQPDQRWGITCGPWGASCEPPDYAQPAPGVTVALKNGWKTLPTCPRPIEQCPWQVNSIGWVRGQGRNYVLAVLTTRNPVGSGDVYGFNYGIDTIQRVSQRVWDNLG